MNESIEKIKKIMTDVATGQAKIQDTNDEYKKLFRELFHFGEDLVVDGADALLYIE